MKHYVLLTMILCLVLSSSLALAETTQIKLLPHAGSESYDLEFTNQEGREYSFPLLDNSNDEGLGFKLGDEEDKFVFLEQYCNEIDYNEAAIAVDDYILVSNESKEENASSRILVFESIDTHDGLLIFSDVSDGSNYEVQFDVNSLSGTDGLRTTTDLIINGEFYAVKVYNSGNVHQDDEYRVCLDLNGDGQFTQNDRVPIVVQGGSILQLVRPLEWKTQLEENDYDAVNLDGSVGSGIILRHSILGKFTSDGYDDYFSIAFSHLSNNNIELRLSSIDMESTGNYSTGTTDYGVRVVDEDGTVTITVPYESTPPYEQISDLNEIAEIGTVSINHHEKYFTFEKSFEDTPIVIMKTPSGEGLDPAHVRITQTGRRGFIVQIQEWDYIAGPHKYEDVSYIAIEPGYYQLGDKTIFAKTGSLGRNAYSLINYADFSVNPVGFTQIQSSWNGENAIVRFESIDENRLSIIAQVEERAAKYNPFITEGLGVLVLDEGSYSYNGEELVVGTVGPKFNQDYKPITKYQQKRVWKSLSNSLENIGFIADMQSLNGRDTASLRYIVGDNDILVKVEEEQSKDKEVIHYAEKIGYIIFNNKDLNVEGRSVLPSELGDNVRFSFSFSEYPHCYSNFCLNTEIAASYSLKDDLGYGAQAGVIIGSVDKYHLSNVKQLFLESESFDENIYHFHSGNDLTNLDDAISWFYSEDEFIMLSLKKQFSSVDEFTLDNELVKYLIEQYPPIEIESEPVRNETPTFIIAIHERSPSENLLLGIKVSTKLLELGDVLPRHNMVLFNELDALAPSHKVVLALNEEIEAVIIVDGEQSSNEMIFANTVASIMDDENVPVKVISSSQVTSSDLNDLFGTQGVIAPFPEFIEENGVTHVQYELDQALSGEECNQWYCHEPFQKASYASDGEVNSATFFEVTSGIENLQIIWANHTTETPGLYSDDSGSYFWFTQENEYVFITQSGDESKGFDSAVVNHFLTTFPPVAFEE